MKKLLGIALLSFAGTSLAITPVRADDANFTSHTNIDSQMTKAIPGSDTPAERQRAATGRLQPRPGGIATSVVKNGPIMFSPTAPASYGNGAQFLTANPNVNGPATYTNVQRQPSDFGGLKIFSWDF